MVEGWGDLPDETDQCDLVPMLLHWTERWSMHVATVLLVGMMATGVLAARWGMQPDQLRAAGVVPIEAPAR